MNLLFAMFATLDDICAIYGRGFTDMHLPYEQKVVAIFNGQLKDADVALLLDTLGFYHESVTHDRKLIISFYSRAIAQGYVNSMNNLANYYRSIGEFVLMKSYYHLAIYHNMPMAMFNLAIYYKDIGQDDKAVFYHIMAIQRANLVKSMDCLGEYYHDTQQYYSMIAYYLLAIANHSTFAMHNLACYYMKQYQDAMVINVDSVYNRALMVKYFAMELEHDISVFPRMKRTLGTYVMLDIMHSSEKLMDTDEYRELVNDM